MTAWRLAGEEVGSCNCDWGCPCQFSARPTTGSCEGFASFDVREGHLGDLSLDGVRFATVLHWPGAIEDGGGTRLLIVDSEASDEQRAAIDALESGDHGGDYFEIFASTAPTRLPLAVAPIEIRTDRERRVASVRIEGLLEAAIEPIRTPVTGEEHRVRIVIPDGFEFTEAEMANTASAEMTIEAPLAITLENTYAQLNAFDWESTT